MSTDRHHGLTEAGRGLLQSAFGTVVMVADEASLLVGVDRLRPDVAVVDLSLARDSKLGWLRAVRKRCPELKVIALSVHDEQSVQSAALEAGADAFVLKRAIATDAARDRERWGAARTTGAHTGAEPTTRVRGMMAITGKTAKRCGITARNIRPNAVALSISAHGELTP